MTTLNLQCVNTSGGNCKGITLYDNFGNHFLVCKPDHIPTDGFIGISDKSFTSNMVRSQEFIDGINQPKNSSDLLERLFTYNTGVNSYSLFTPELMRNSIASDLSLGNLMVYSLDDNKPLFVDQTEVCTQKNDVELESGAKKIQTLPEKVQIIPVRYALDESQILVKEGATEHLIMKNTEGCVKPHGLPKKGKFSGGYFKGALTKNSYTLRQLTDGWLYVWDDGDGQKLDEYQVDGTQLILCDGNRKANGAAKVYLEYPTTSVLYIIFSPIQMSERLFKELKNSTLEVAKKRRKWGRKVTCSIFSEVHTGLFEEVIDSVADIGDKEKAIFPLAVPSIEDRTDDDEAVIPGKPIQTVDTYRGALSDPTTARVVAIDDLVSDINDMVSQTAYLQGLLYENSSSEMAKRATAKAVVMFCNGSSEKRLPDSVNKLNEATYLDDLNNYYKDKDKLDSYIATHYSPYESTPQGDYNKKINALREDFKKKYDVYPSMTGYLSWSSQKHDTYVDEDAAMSFLKSSIKHDRGIYKTADMHIAELIACHYKIKPDSAFLALDNLDIEGHTFLMEWMLTSFDVLVATQDDDLISDLSNKIFINEEANSLIALSFSAFDSQFRKQFRDILLKFPAGGVIDTDNATVTRNEWKEDKLSSLISGIKSTISDYMDNFGKNNLTLNSWINKLSGTAKLSIQTMKLSVASKATEAWSGYHAHQYVLYDKITGTMTGDVAQTNPNPMDKSAPRTVVNGQLKTENGRLLMGSALMDAFVDPNDNQGLQIGANYVKRVSEWKSNALKWNTELGIALKAEEAIRENNPERTEWRAATRRTNKCIAKLIHFLKKMPNVIEIANKNIRDAHTNAVLLQLDHAMKKTGKVVSSGVSYSGIALGLWTLVVMDHNFQWNFDFRRGSDNMRKTYAELSAIANIGAATTSLLSGAAETLTKTFNDINDTGVFGKIDGIKDLVRLSKLNAIRTYKSFGEAIYIEVKQWRFFYGALGAFSIFASVFDILTLYPEFLGDSQGTLDDLEYTLTAIKGIATFVQFGGGIYFELLASGIVNPMAWVNPVMFVAGLVVLVSSILLFYWTRDDIDKWLETSRFSTVPDKIKWQRSYEDESAEHKAAIEEYGALQDLLMTPQVYAETATKDSFYSTAYGGQVSHYIVDGYWLILYIPGLPAEWTVQVAEVKNNFTVINQSVTHSKPRYITETQYQEILLNGLPQSFNDKVFDKEITDEKEFNKDTANTGLYLYPLKLEHDRSNPIKNLNSKIALKLKRKNSSVFYSYIVDFDKRKGQVIKQVKDSKTLPSTFQTLNIVSQPYNNNKIVSG